MLIGYLILVNATSFLLMLTDKHKAKKKLWRISESSLLGVSVIGGSIGALAGMYAFRHKTKHPKFFIGLPIILAVQIAIAALLLFAKQ